MNASSSAIPRGVSAIVILAVAFTSFSSILIRLSEAPPLVIAAWRMILATAILAPLGAVHGVLRGAASAAPAANAAANSAAGAAGPDVKTAAGAADPDVETTAPDMATTAPGVATASAVALKSRVNVFVAVALSGTFLALHFATWITSLSYTTVLHSTVLVTIHPLIVLISSHFFLGDRIGWRRLIATLIAFVGAVVLAGGGSARGMEPTLTGDALAVAGGVAVAVYLMIGRVARRTLSAAQYNTGVHAVAAVVLVALTVAFGRRLAPYPPIEFLIFAALAFFCTVLGHALMNWALKYVSANDVSRSILLEPVFAAVPAALLFGEIPGIRTVIGAVLVLSGIGVVFLERGGKRGSEGRSGGRSNRRRDRTERDE